MPVSVILIRPAEITDFYNCEYIIVLVSVPRYTARVQRMTLSSHQDPVFAIFNLAVACFVIHHRHNNTAILCILMQVDSGCVMQELDSGPHQIGFHIVNACMPLS